MEGPSMVTRRRMPWINERRMATKMVSASAVTAVRRWMRWSGLEMRVGMYGNGLLADLAVGSANLVHFNAETRRRKDAERKDSCDGYEGSFMATSSERKMK